MRIIFFAITVFMLSCDQDSTNQKRVSLEDSLKKYPDTLSAGNDTVPKTTPLESEINEILKKKFGIEWQVVNDREAQWPQDVFDYFIAGKRKQNPDYPYIAKGDFNADSKQDLAALLVNDKKDKYRIAIMIDSAIVLWEDDVQGAAIATNPKEEIGGIDGKMVKMKSEGINVEFFEKSSWVLYWNGSSFKKIWTGD